MLSSWPGVAGPDCAWIKCEFVATSNAATSITIFPSSDTRLKLSSDIAIATKSNTMLPLQVNGRFLRWKVKHKIEYYNIVIGSFHNVKAPLREVSVVLE
jgi:hypothetical protein